MNFLLHKKAWGFVPRPFSSTFANIVYSRWFYVNYFLSHITHSYNNSSVHFVSSYFFPFQTAFSNTNIFSANLFTPGIQETRPYKGVSVSIPRTILSSFTFWNPAATSPRSAKLLAPQVKVAPVALIDFSIPSFFTKNAKVFQFEIIFTHIEKYAILSFLRYPLIICLGSWKFPSRRLH